MTNLNERLDGIIPKIRESKFVEGRGLGNEVSFYVFDYAPKDELIVRDYVKHLMKEFDSPGSERRIIEFDLYKMLLDIAKEKRIFNNIFQMEERQSKEKLLKALKTFAQPEIFLKKIKNNVGDYNVVFITGVGKVYPFLRSHNLLNNLQTVLDKVPVIMFYPGEYSGQDLKLFGKFKDDNYYRAFRLID
ncbi:hypothetical protein ABE17_06345 [Bacillus mycoides]|uniref:DUF1788 domain-containing protein n=1 Tax=Bacillus mycoides TaxID=1405 RepID=UPI0018CDF8E9|nr:DUF1788 domain-containing protein [Bacillus mycoides]MBG9596520.1 hypothetical protein [Bacillus mycoides]